MKVGNVRLTDVDIPGYFSTKELHVEALDKRCLITKLKEPEDPGGASYRPDDL